MTRKPKYQQRLILFLDFLGFKEIVEASTTDAKVLHRVCQAIDRIRSLADSREYSRTQKVTQFSDSLVVSYRVDERSSVFDLVSNIAFIIIDLVQRGFLVRGAVTVGELHHTRKHLIGPAMNRAYDLESKVARYPRVLIDDEVIRLAGVHRAEQNSAIEERRYVRSFLARDTDGYQFLDYISWNAVVHAAGAESDLFPAYLFDLSNIIANGLGHTDPSVLEKYLWLHARYVAELKIYDRIPRDDPRRVELSEFYEQVAALPRLVDLADDARKRALRNNKAKRHPVRNSTRKSPSIAKRRKK